MVCILTKKSNSVHACVSVEPVGDSRQGRAVKSLADIITHNILLLSQQHEQILAPLFFLKSP